MYHREHLRATQLNGMTKIAMNLPVIILLIFAFAPKDVCTFRIISSVSVQYDVGSRFRYLSDTGSDSADCLTPLTPCASLSRAFHSPSRPSSPPSRPPESPSRPPEFSSHPSSTPIPFPDRLEIKDDSSTWPPEVETHTSTGNSMADLVTGRTRDIYTELTDHLDFITTHPSYTDIDYNQSESRELGQGTAYVSDLFSDDMNVSESREYLHSINPTTFIHDNGGTESSFGLIATIVTNRDDGNERKLNEQQNIITETTTTKNNLRRVPSSREIDLQPNELLENYHNIHENKDLSEIPITIFIYNSQSTPLCVGDLDISQNVTLQGTGDRTVLGCPDHHLNLTVRGSKATIPTLTIKNMVLITVVLKSLNARFCFDNVEADQCLLNVSPTSSYLELDFTNSRWTVRPPKGENVTSASCCEVNAVRVKVDTAIINWDNMTFVRTKFILRAGEVNAKIRNSTFKQLEGAINVLGGLQIIVENKVKRSYLTILNSSFIDQYFENPIHSVQNLYEAALLLRAIDDPNNTLPSNVVAVVHACHFNNNERGLSFIGPFNTSNVTSSTFENNIAMHAGAGILSLADPVSMVYVQDSVFHSNAAGFYRKDKISSRLDSFQITGDEVKISSDCCNGVVAFVGKGGGIRVQRGRMTIERCVFFNNTARLLGGAVFVERESTVVIEDVQMENSDIDEHSLEGDLIYSNGEMTIRSADLRALSARNHVSLLHHSGIHWSLDVNRLSLVCPMGHRLRTTNTSAYGVTNIGLRRSHKLDQLSYFCESCPRNRYSLESGYVQYNVTYLVFAYFTLLINYETPQSAFSGMYVHHDITCLPCPYGGHCLFGISAVPNFWGYVVDGSRIKFQICPKGYCCSSAEGCRTYNQCAPHRTGTLCGRCREGYSEALFSPKCVPDDLCNSMWLWPVMLFSGLLYFLFLLFQKDIRELMFSLRINIGDVNCRPRKHQGKERWNGNNCPDQKVSPLERFDEHSKIDTNTVFNDSQNDLLSDEGEVVWYKRVENSGCYSSVTPFSKSEVRLKDGTTPETKLLEKRSTTTKTLAPDMGASFLIIIFFYFQDAQLLQIKTVFAEDESKFIATFRTILTGLFKFRLEITEFVSQICFLSGLTPTTKLLVRSLLVPYVIAQFGVAYLLYRLCVSSASRTFSTSSATSMSSSKRLCTQPSLNSGSSNTEAKSRSYSCISLRLSTGFVLSLLFMYQKMASTSFALLNCVPVENYSVLFIDGTVRCYQTWQYGVLAYTLTCVVPFCLALLIGPGLLGDSLISTSEFFLGCIIPLPLLIRWFWIRIRCSRNPALLQQWRRVRVSHDSKAVIQILQGPFKNSRVHLLGPVCGQGVLIARRLVLVLLYTFVTNTLFRLIYTMLFCFVILLHHAHALPYKERIGNLAGAISAAGLVVIGGINLVRAGFDAAEYIPQGPNADLMKVFDQIENILMLWIPAAVMAFSLISLVYKLMVMPLRCFLGRQKESKASGTTATSSLSV